MTLTTHDAGAHIQRYFSALSAWFDSVEGRARQLQNPRIRMLTQALSHELAAPETQAALAGDAPPELLEALYHRCVRLLTLCGLESLIPLGMKTINIMR
jgi:hypothetical protein